MSSIETRQFNWLPRQSAWQTMENWREKHRAFQDQADATVSTAAEIFGGAAASLGSGMNEIAARRAQARVAAALKAAQAASVNRLA